MRIMNASILCVCVFDSYFPVDGWNVGMVTSVWRIIFCNINPKFKIVEPKASKLPGSPLRCIHFECMQCTNSLLVLSNANRFLGETPKLMPIGSVHIWPVLYCCCCCCFKKRAQSPYAIAMACISKKRIFISVTCQIDVHQGFDINILSILIFCAVCVCVCEEVYAVDDLDQSSIFACTIKNALKAFYKYRFQWNITLWPLRILVRVCSPAPHTQTHRHTHTIWKM